MSTEPHRFRFGLMAEHVTGRDELVATALHAEAAGYSTYLIRDHFTDEPFGPQLGPIASLATVAAVTSTLRIGSLVLCNDYRHPALLAQEAATLDLLSGGRFELGLGRWRPPPARRTSSISCRCRRRAGASSTTPRDVSRR